MKITTALALKYLRKNKKRNYAIVLGIALATILLISVFILIASYQEYIVNIIRDEKNWEVIAKEVTLTLLQLRLNDRIQNIFSKHKNGMWGIALSTDSFEYVNGVQLYFNP